MRQTRIHDEHVALGARMVDFGGWRMPVQYGPILEEVTRVRTFGGLFDLGHMGRFEVRGPDAVRFVDRITSNFCAKIPLGSIRYALLCNEDGYPLDDLLVYRDTDTVYLVVNAANLDRDLAWMQHHAKEFDAEVVDLTEEQGMLAFQGQRSTEVLQELVEDLTVADLKYYKFGRGTVCGIEGVRISRTGYTGETGYELYLPQDETLRVWNALREVGEPRGIKPIGLGARDTLRLEAGMALYGHEIDESHDGLEAGADFAISFAEEKGDWIGRDALLARKATPSRKLIGFTTAGPRVPRQGLTLYLGDEEVGTVCSGSVSPTLETNIGTAHVRLGVEGPGQELELDFRGKRQPCTVQELPFFSRTRK
jgi:aminomethyltransferase